jgi:hypothetical protein
MSADKQEEVWSAWHTSTGDKNEPHSTTSFPKAEYGPHFSVFLSLPKVLSSS